MSTANVYIIFEESEKRSAAYIDGNLIGECKYCENESKWIIYQAKSMSMSQL